MKPTISIALITLGLAAACTTLGYRQRDYEANAAAKERTLKQCRQWAKERGTYKTTARDGSPLNMPIRWCNSLEFKNATLGFEHNVTTGKGKYVKRWEWF